MARKTKAKFRVLARLDSRAVEATLVIDRQLELVTVRPLRRRRTYELPLSWVAEAIYRRVVLNETQAKKAAKKLARRK